MQSGHFARQLGPLVEVLRAPNLRRLQLGLAGSMLGQWGFAVALAVYSFDRGGTGLVGVAVFVRLAPQALGAPFAGVLADRFPRERVLVLCELTRALAVGLAAVMIAVDAPTAVVFILVGINGAISSAFEPTKAALMPSLTRTPQELIAANVVGGAITSVGMFAGPALGALLLVATSVEVVFAATAAALLWSAALVAGVRVEHRGRAAAPVDGEGALAHLFAGVRMIAGNRRLALIVGLFSTQTLVAGALNVLVWVLALDELDLRRGWVGYFVGAVGVGGIAGTLAAASLVSRQRVAGGFGTAMFMWGAPLVLIGVFADRGVALAALVVVGIANTLIDVAGPTLLQRAVEEGVLARVFGALETLLIGTLALGGLAVSPLIDGLGVEVALIATGLLLPTLAVLSWPVLRRVDLAAVIPPSDKLDLLAGMAIFAPLPRGTLEQLARGLKPRRVADGEDVVRQGEIGDRYYVIAQGEVEVFVDGRSVRHQYAGEGFGEIALLHEVPRTATVTALGDVELYSLERDEFVAAVTGHPESLKAADSVVIARLSGARPSLASL